MARFIVDVANIDADKVKEINELIVDSLNENELTNGLITSICIDPSNKNQFHEDKDKNILSEEQINNFTLILNHTT